METEVFRGYSKESEKRTGGRPGIIDFRPNLASQFFYLDSGAGHDNVRRAKTQFSLLIVSATFGLGNQQKPYDFKAFLMISGDFSWPTGLAAGRLAVRLEAPASRSVLLFRFLRQFLLSDSLLYRRPGAARQRYLARRGGVAGAAAPRRPTVDGEAPPPR